MDVMATIKQKNTERINHNNDITSQISIRSRLRQDSIEKPQDEYLYSSIFKTMEEFGTKLPEELLQIYYGNWAGYGLFGQLVSRRENWARLTYCRLEASRIVHINDLTAKRDAERGKRSPNDHKIRRLEGSIAIENDNEIFNMKVHTAFIRRSWVLQKNNFWRKIWPITILTSP